MLQQQKPLNRSAPKQLNYQMLYSKLEQAICETKAQFPNSEVTSFLMNKVETYLAEIQTILRGN